MPKPLVLPAERIYRMCSDLAAIRTVLLEMASVAPTEEAILMASLSESMRSSSYSLEHLAERCHDVHHELHKTQHIALDGE